MFPVTMYDKSSNYDGWNRAIHEEFINAKLHNFEV